MNGQELLIKMLLTEISDTLKRQLGEMEFFSPIINPTSSSSQTISENPKMEHAEITNLGCESQFAKMDQKLHVTRGSTSVQTLSRKNVVATKAYLVDSTCVEMDEKDKRSKWKWARHSNEVKTVRKMKEDFLLTVKNSKQIALVKKEELKQKKNKKSLIVLEKCKLHRGPVTPNNINIFVDLSESGLLLEVTYLRHTVAPDIHQHRRVKLDDGRYKFEKFSNEELRTAIRNAVKPESDLSRDVCHLLKSVFML